MVDIVEMRQLNDKGLITNLWEESVNDWDTVPLQKEIVNEKGEKSGKFGWCYMCRQAAWFYCKEERVPICSFECKLKNMDNNEQLKKML